MRKFVRNNMSIARISINLCMYCLRLEFSSGRALYTDGDAVITGVENAGVETAGEGQVWKAKVLKCVSDYIDPKSRYDTPLFSAPCMACNV